MDISHQYTSVICAHCGTKIVIPVYCKNRFCEICSVSRRARIRDKLDQFQKNIVLQKGETLKMLTLTIPRDSDLNTMVTVLLKSFRRLRQRAFWKKAVSGGAFVVEFKHTADGWNPHLHILMQSKFIPVKQLSKYWSKVSPGRIVDIRRIPQGVISRYITKYITKSELPLQLQYQASAALRNRRLYQPFGNWVKQLNAIPVKKQCCPECGADAWAYDGPPGYVTRILLEKRGWMNRKEYEAFCRSRDRTKPPPKMPCETYQLPLYCSMSSNKK